MKLISSSILFWLFCHSLLADDWHHATTFMEKGEWQKAVAILEPWIAQHRMKGEFSAEAHLNLASCYRALNQIDKTTPELLRALQLSDSPAQIATILQSLKEIEKGQGILKSVVDSFSFQLQSYSRENWMKLIALVTLWIISLAWLAFRKINSFALSLSILPIIASMLLWGGRKLTPQYAVLFHSSQQIALYSNLNPLESKLELPSGTLIELTKEKKDQFQKISKPVAGWVPISVILRP